MHLSQLLFSLFSLHIVPFGHYFSLFSLFSLIFFAASELIHQCKDETLKLRYKVCFARIMDYKRQFMKAAARYYELSQIVSEEERIEALSYACICTILASAGPQRSRMLATLYKDERSAKLDIYPILEKM